MAKRVVVVNVRLPENILGWLDSLVDSQMFNSRSEAIREFSREYVIRNRDTGSRGGSGSG